ncbi:MAG TPA: CYCXC family (seleno)protein [Pyrinomonadaceae bacterium]
MKTKIILSVLLALAALFAVACGEAPARRSSGSQQTGSQTARVPAFMDASQAKSLGPTLSPERFTGQTRDAYRAVQEIPETIAQLPCYCECDRSIGHKSLHSCFEDGHATQCAVCVNEALIAYKLHKSGLTPVQIRERIIEQYSRQ